MTQIEENSPGISRRSMITGTISVAALAALGIDLSSIPAFATSALDQAVNEAQSMIGFTVGQANAAMDNGPWKNTAPGAWCAWWASYICRATGTPRIIGAPELYDYYPGHYGSPQRGDVIYYDPPATGAHVGFVVDVVGGVAHTVEGNTSGDPTHVKSYSHPWTTPVGFARPDWGNATGTVQIIGKGDMYIVWNDHGGAAFVCSKGVTYVQGFEHDLLKRMLVSDQTQTPAVVFNDVEISEIQAVIARCA